MDNPNQSEPVQQYLSPKLKTIFRIIIFLVGLLGVLSFMVKGYDVGVNNLASQPLWYALWLVSFGIFAVGIIDFLRFFSTHRFVSKKVGKYILLTGVIVLTLLCILAYFE